jgi:hypothetical protein
VVPSAAGATTSPSMIADLALIGKASSAIFLNRQVQSRPLRVKTVVLSLAMWSCTRYQVDVVIVTIRHRSNTDGNGWIKKVIRLSW